ncbi:hypothetical protein GCM10023183_11110 [Nibribacter koreensis]|uniref:DUF3885 domain-containing protein n=1 Tax=Nibribacter koreensis TaxID=1084519 RepID=A0ABP8FD83_9BACT
MYLKVSRLYDAKDKSEFWNVAVIKLRVDRINYHQILKAISVVDFPPRQPRIDNRGFLSNKQVFFLNINLRIIYHMYDDRGLDIVASNKETLLPLYKDFNNWILESNRTQIDNNLMKEIDFGLPKI